MGIIRCSILKFPTSPHPGILSPNYMKILKQLILVGTLLAIGLATGGLCSAGESTSTPTLTIDADQTVAHISPTMYGMMTEEINHSYDGGLYGELVQNRVFKDNATAPVHWYVDQGPAAATTITLDNDNALNAFLIPCLRLDVTAATDESPAGVANDGYWGIPVLAHTRYQASFYAKAAAGLPDLPFSVKTSSIFVPLPSR